MRRVPVLMTSLGTRVLRRRRSLMLPASRSFIGNSGTGLAAAPLLFPEVASIGLRCHQLLKPIAIRAADIQFCSILQHQCVLAVEPGHRFPDARHIDDGGAVNANEESGIKAFFD